MNDLKLRFLLHCKTLKSMPSINGKEVDLDLLYQIVTSHGGWEKVNTRNEWDDLLEHFNLPRGINGGLVIKQIYLKYLENYEKIYFLGEEVNKDDGEDDFDDDIRSRRRTANKYTSGSRSQVQSISQTPAAPQQNTPMTDAQREQLGLSTKPMSCMDYERLLLSLQSPLPNDQDLAISVCTLLSNETKHVLKFSKCPAILNMLLAHAGIYQHCGMRIMMEEVYKEARGLSIAEFWDDILDHKETKPLICETYLQRIQTSLGSTEEDDTRLQEDVTYPFTLTRSSDSEDKMGQRIQQIAHILRNLSFESDNASIMGQNSTLLRYLLITANCSWGTLPQMSFDLLGNIAPHINLQDPVKDPLSSMLLSLVSSGLFSPDRFKVLRSLEIIRELTKTPVNETIIVKYMENKVYSRMCELLTICDIMLLICTLECILAMTELGEAVCNELVRVKGSVSTLVSLVTVEAQSYGPKGCILMRVVETVTGGSQGVQAGQPSSASAPGALTTTSSPQTSPAISSPSTTGVVQPLHPSTPILNSISSIGLRTVSGQTVVPPSQQQQGASANYAPPNSNNEANAAAPNVFNPNSSLQQQHLRTVLRPNAPQSSPCIKVVNMATPVRITRSADPILSSNTQIINRAPVLAQVHGKPGLPNMVNHVNSSNSVLTTNSPAPVLNNVNHTMSGSMGTPMTTTSHGAGATSIGGLAQDRFQVSSHSLTQQVYTPSINLVSPPKGEGGEEQWLTSWLRTGFESGSATSIEQEKFYMMYCCTRNDKSAVLPMEKFIQVVKSAFGASAGPVMKTFGDVSLQFLNGISPKITLQTQQGSNQPSVGLTAPVIEIPNAVNSTQQVSISNSNSENSFVPSSNGVPTLNPQPNSPAPTTPVRPPTPGQLPATVHIPSPMSPILKATLSRPPTPKSPPPNVAQRQQNKLQQQETKSSKNKGNTAGEKRKKQPIGKHSKMNGGLKPSSEKEESSASSSLNSIEETDIKTGPSSLTFQGVLCNGGNSEEPMQLGSDIPDEVVKTPNVKGMLVDLLERKVPSKDLVNVNGLVGRELRISERGLELIEKEDSNSGTSSSLFNNSLADTQEPQQMTFYASPIEIEQQVQTQPVEPTVDSNNPTFYISESIDENRGSNDSSQSGLSRKPVTQNQVKKQISEDQGLESGADGFGDGNINANSDIMNNSNGEGGSNGANIAGDFLDKFNQFSDLIVVNPEQLGLKRPSSDNSSEPSTDQAPPAKKPAITINGNDNVPCTTAPYGLPVSINSVTTSSVPMTITSSPSVLHNALSSPTTSTGTKLTTEYPINVVQNQIMQLPSSIRLTIDRSNPNLLSFSGGKILMRPGGAPLIFAPSQLTSNQMIYSKGSGTNDIPKIYLVQPNQTSQLGLPQQMTMTVVHDSTSNTVPGNNLAALVPKPDGVPPPAYSHVPPEELENEIPYLCEWPGCGYRFSKPQFVFMHCVKLHISESVDTPSPCKWGNRCDPLLRKKLCLMTHLQDRHCNNKMLEVAVYRRKNKIEPPPAGTHPPNHPMYAPNAAFHAIKRHAMQYANPKDLMDENEGPVTKSIRLTSALILRNLVNYSTLGRRLVGTHESHLSTIAMSNVESSRTVAQLLHDMSEEGS